MGDFDTNKSNKFFIAVCILLLLNGLLCIIIYHPKFKNVTLELGVDKFNINDFVWFKIYKKNAKCLTDLSILNLDEVSEGFLEFSYNSKRYTVGLSIIDTTPPEVVFKKDVVKPLNYKFNVEDFIESVKDYSDYEFMSNYNNEKLELGTYSYTISVIDKYGNVSQDNVNLEISNFKDNVIHELGNKFSLNEIVLDKQYVKYLDKELVKKVNVNKVGKYSLEYKYNNKKYVTVVEVKDTSVPLLTLKNITYVIGTKKPNNKDFVKKVSDNSDNVTLSYKDNFNFTKKGEYKILVTALDPYGNEVTKSAILYVKDDITGPVIKGLSTITISKGQTINYKANVSAVDNKDGNVSFDVNSSKVNINKVGTYYATYTAKDSSSNITTKKRKIVVTHTAQDTKKEFNAYFNKKLAGKSVMGIVRTIRKDYTYTHANETKDPVWYGLQNKKGNCIVHAYLVKAALDKIGVTNKIIYTTNKTHYWNLVYQNGSWCHYDSTPGSHIPGPANDLQKYTSKGMRGRDWNRNLFPVANC